MKKLRNLLGAQSVYGFHFMENSYHYFCVYKFLRFGQLNSSNTDAQNNNFRTS